MGSFLSGEETLVSVPFLSTSASGSGLKGVATRSSSVGSVRRGERDDHVLEKGVCCPSNEHARPSRHTSSRQVGVRSSLPS